MGNTRNHRTKAPGIRVSTHRVRFTLEPLAVQDAAPPIGDTVTTPAGAAEVARAVIEVTSANPSLRYFSMPGTECGRLE